MPTPVKTRILLLSAGFGAGHDQTSRAVKEMIQSLDPESDVAVRDFFDFVSRPLSRLIAFLYIRSVRHAPFLYGIFYKVTGDVKPDSIWQRWLNTMGARRLTRFIKEYRPSAIICTYPTPVGVLSTMRADGCLSIPLFAIVTDFTVHSQWIHSNVDHYFVACDEVAEGMIARGIARDRITVTGIPIRRAFSRPVSVPSDARFNIADGRTTILVMAGAFTMLGGLTDVVRSLIRLDDPIQLVVITGSDKLLAERIRFIAKDSPHPVHVLGFTDEIPYLMNKADILISKSGGITVSEALASRLPIVVFRDIPGQGRMNTDYLVKNGAGMLAKTSDELASIVKDLCARKEALDSMKAAADRIKRPDAAVRVAEAVMGANQ